MYKCFIRDYQTNATCPVVLQVHLGATLYVVIFEYVYRCNALLMSTGPVDWLAG